MKLYYARSIDGKKTIQFRGETLVVNQPFLIEYLVDNHNEKVKTTKKNVINMKDYIVIEIEAEIKNEKK